MPAGDDNHGHVLLLTPLIFEDDSVVDGMVGPGLAVLLGGLPAVRRLPASGRVNRRHAIGVDNDLTDLIIGQSSTDDDLLLWNWSGAGQPERPHTWRRRNILADFQPIRVGRQ